MRSTSARSHEYMKSHSGPIFCISSSLRNLQTSDIARHKDLPWGHLHKAWKEHSGSVPQIGHTLVTSLFLECFVTPVGKGSVTNLHTKVHTLAGAMHLHNDAQMARRPSGALLAAPMESYWSSLSADRYALLTEKMSFFSSAQAMNSSARRRDALILRISSISQGRKCCQSKSIRHAPFTSSSSATHLRRQRPFADTSMRDGGSGIHLSLHIWMLFPLPTRQMISFFRSSSS